MAPPDLIDKRKNPADAISPLGVHKGYMCGDVNSDKEGLYMWPNQQVFFISDELFYLKLSVTPPVDGVKFFYVSCLMSRLPVAHGLCK